MQDLLQQDIAEWGHKVKEKNSSGELPRKAQGRLSAWQGKEMKAWNLRDRRACETSPPVGTGGALAAGGVVNFSGDDDRGDATDCYLCATTALLLPGCA
jgi:hypothetical protein